MWQSYSDRLADHKLETQKEFQKGILLISGGALTVSLTFSDGIVTLGNPLVLWSLIIARIILLVTVVMQLIYYYQVKASTQALIDKIKLVIDGTEPEATFDVEFNKKMAALDLLNLISIVFMTIGLVLITIFFSYNTWAQSKAKPPVESDGSKKTEAIYDSSKCCPMIKIENNPVFINNGKSDTIRKKEKCYHKPC